MKIENNTTLFCFGLLSLIQTNCYKVNIENRSNLDFKDDQTSICNLCDESYVASRGDHLFKEHQDEMKLACLYVGVWPKYKSKKRKHLRKTSSSALQPRRIVPTRVSESEMQKASYSSIARNLHAICKTKVWILSFKSFNIDWFYSQLGNIFNLRWLFIAMRD